MSRSRDWRQWDRDTEARLLGKLVSACDRAGRACGYYFAPAEQMGERGRPLHDALLKEMRLANNSVARLGNRIVRMMKKRAKGVLQPKIRLP